MVQPHPCQPPIRLGKLCLVAWFSKQQPNATAGSGGSTWQALLEAGLGLKGNHGMQGVLEFCRIMLSCCAADGMALQGMVPLGLTYGADRLHIVNVEPLLHTPVGPSGAIMSLSPLGMHTVTCTS